MKRDLSGKSNSIWDFINAIGSTGKKVFGEVTYSTGLSNTKPTTGRAELVSQNGYGGLSLAGKILGKITTFAYDKNNPNNNNPNLRVYPNTDAGLDEYANDIYVNNKAASTKFLLDILDDPLTYLPLVLKGAGALKGTSGSNKLKVPKATELTMTETVKNHATDIIKKGVNAGELSRPYVDSQGTNLLLQEIMDSGVPVKDVSLPNGLRWDVPGSFNGRGEGIWELVVDVDTNKIVHFNFTK